MNRIFASNRKILTLASIGMTALMFGLEISSIPVILPSLEKVIGGSFSELQWIMNAYTIACTTVLMATGSLADKYGRKKLYIISIALFGLSSLACGLASSVYMLIMSRFLQGIGGGAMLICQIAVLSQEFQEGRERSVAFSVWGIVFGAGLGLGPVIGAAIMAVSTWKWVFLIHVLISGIALLLVTSGVQESKNPHARGVDVRGMLLLSLAVFGLTLYITQGAEHGFNTPIGIGTISATALLFLLFLRAEKTSPYPMFDFSVFRIRSFSGALLGSMGMNFSFWPFMIYFPIYFQHGLGYDVVTTGSCLLAYTIPTLIVPPLAERLILKFRSGIIIPAGMFTIGLGFFMMKYSMALEHAGWITILPGCVMSGIGLGLTNTPATNTTTSSLPTNMAGMASGIDMSARLITLAINIALMGLLLVAGIFSYLHAALPETAHTSQLPILSEKIAAGKTISVLPVGSFPKDTHTLVRAALINGFEWVALYAAIAAWSLGLTSFFVLEVNNNNVTPTNYNYDIEE